MTTRLEVGWQEERPLAYCTGIMLETCMLSDIVFKVGETKTESIQAHRNILACRSPVFEAMFCGDIREGNKKPIRIEDIEPNTFKDLLTYLYTDDITLGKDNALQLLYAARKYILRKLETRCAEFIKDNIKISTVCTIFTHSLKYHDDELSEICLDFIQDNTKAVLADPDYLSLSNEGVCIMLDQDNLEEFDEVTLYKETMRWARHRLQDMGLNDSEEQMRDVLGQALFLIRFPTFSIREFGEVCGTGNILSAEEKVSIFNYLALGSAAGGEETEETVAGFPTQPRRPEEPFTVDRFPKVLAGWGYGDGDRDAVEVIVDQKIQLMGVAVYGPTVQGVINVRLEVTDTSGTLLSSFTTQHIKCDGTDTPVPVKFDSSVALEENSSYTISAFIHSPYSATTYYSGSGGISSLVTANGCSFTFTDSARRSRSTDAVPGRGQIAQLLYKMKK